MEVRIADEKERAEVFNLRMEVFVNEQKVPAEIEIDEEDGGAIHIAAYEGGEIVGCGRIVFGENDAHVGRIAVKKELRGSGVGRAVCRFIIDYCKARGVSCIRLGAQLHAVGFYEKLGFKTVGDTFMEAGIEHIEMEIRQ